MVYTESQSQHGQLGIVSTEGQIERVSKEGDEENANCGRRGFWFAASLGTAFDSAANMVATSLDSKDIIGQMEMVSVDNQLEMACSENQLEMAISETQVKNEKKKRCQMEIVGVDNQLEMACSDNHLEMASSENQLEMVGAGNQLEMAGRYRGPIIKHGWSRESIGDIRTDPNGNC
ncbi:hypothetical protein SADUNF_Sadunf16G0288800 [Salix dunnii]|uniref:Uncharacterized protein n=1 Tax=Salix dunnii TaxID=1413687 RepID=A0A835JEF0_9ROSI|nr:hypothetical protein SADUNF_Sadunf16G0288800 [Salix dunnii]